MLHYKADGIAAAATAKTFIYFFAGRNSKRRSFLVMKRAKAKIIGTSLFQFYKAPYHIHDVNPAKYLLYGIGGNQAFDNSIANIGIDKDMMKSGQIITCLIKINK
jgi:hypothetical protein